MKFGLWFCNTGRYVDPTPAVSLAQAAEAAGFESLWTVEHTIVPAGYSSAYPYAASGKMPGGREDFPLPDPLIWMAFVAASTTTIKLGTGILILPQHNPLLVAKQIATLDHLSRGRVLLGIGIGWLREEFAALGVPFEARGARTDEYVTAMRELWFAEKPTFNGRFVSFKDAYCRPQVGCIFGCCKNVGPLKQRVSGASGPWRGDIRWASLGHARPRLRGKSLRELLAIVPAQRQPQIARLFEAPHSMTQGDACMDPLHE